MLRGEHPKPVEQGAAAPPIHRYQAQILLLLKINRNSTPDFLLHLAGPPLRRVLRQGRAGERRSCGRVKK